VRRVINAMVEDVLDETRRRLAEAAPKVGRRHRALAGRWWPSRRTWRRPTAREGVPLQAHVRALEANRSHSKARRVVTDLFGLLFAEPELLPPAVARAPEQAGTRPAPAWCDYIAGMTDRFAPRRTRRLFDLYE